MRRVYGQALSRSSISSYKGIMHVEGNFYIEHAKIYKQSFTELHI